MPVRGERVERHVAQHADLGHRLLQRRDGAADQIVGVDRLAAVGVLERRVDRREHRDRRDAERGGLAGGVDQRRDRDGGTRPASASTGARPCFVMDEDRPDQVAGGQHALGDELARPGVAAVAPQARGRVGRQRRQVGLGHDRVTPLDKERWFVQNRAARRRDNAPADARRREGGSVGQIRHRAAHAAARVGRPRQGLFRPRGARLRIPRPARLADRRCCTTSATRSAPTRPSSAAATPMSAAPATGRSTSPPRPGTASCTPTPIRWRRRRSSCRPNRDIRDPADLAGVPISVGYQSGSHYSTIQALEQYLPADQINLSFADGLLFRRMELLIDRQVPAAALFSGPYYFMEQLGFRKIIDTTFMMASMITGDPDPRTCASISARCAPAQRDIDLRPELYTHYYARGISAALPRRDGHAAAGAPASASCSSRYTPRGLRRIVRLDRQPRHLPRGRHGRRQLRRGGVRWGEAAVRFAAL